MEGKILVINTENDQSKWDYNCFLKVTNKKGNTFLRKLKHPASYYFASEEALEKGLKMGYKWKYYN